MPNAFLSNKKANRETAQEDFLTFSTLRAAQNYTRYPARVFNATSGNADLFSYFNNKINEQEAVCPAEGYLTLHDGYLHDGKYILDKQADWLDESIVDLASVDIFLASLRGVLQEGHDVTFPLTVNAVDVICLAKAGAGNYGHFITEIAPKFVHLAKLAQHNAMLLLPDECLRFGEIITTTLSALSININICFVKPGSLHAMPTLVFITNVSQHDFRKSPTLLEWRTAILAHFGVTPTPKRKLFVRRAPGEKRNMTNITEVERALAACGFESVYPGELSFAEQVKLFASASHVIGGLGAGLSNILFADSAAKIFMISPGLMDFFFWDISCLLKQEFNWFFAAPLQHYSQELAEANFEVPVAKLLISLQEAGWLA